MGGSSCSAAGQGHRLPSDAAHAGPEGREGRWPGSFLTHQQCLPFLVHFEGRSVPVSNLYYLEYTEGAFCLWVAPRVRPLWVFCSEHLEVSEVALL